MPAPTKNDWNSFQVESFENKVNVLFYYLCKGGYNMQEIAEQILRDYNPHAAQRVSLITRCYGFGGSNGGTFRSIGATREDVAAFVRAYPNGCEYDGKGKVMKEYLLKRVQARNKPQRTAVYDKEYKRSEEFSGGSISDKAGNIIEIVLMIVMFCVLKFVLDWNWIVSIIAAIVVVPIAEVFIARTINKRN